jgi:hypothetical protein
MANLTPVPQWVGAYQLEQTDLVLGGAGGVSNTPHQNILDRTEYLYDAIIAAGSDLTTPVDIKFTGDTNSNMLYADVSQDNVGIGKAPTTGFTMEIQNYSASGDNLRLAASSGTPTSGAEISLADKSNVTAFTTGVGSAGDYFIFDNIATATQFEIEKTTGKVTVNPSAISTADFNAQGDTDANLLLVDASQDNIGIGVAPNSIYKLHVSSTLTNAIFATNSGGTGIAGVTTSSSTSVYGISGTANNGGSGSAGAFGSSTNSIGIGAFGQVTHATGACQGVKGEVTVSTSASSYGVHGVNSGSGKPVAGNGAYFDTTSTKFMKIQKQPSNILDSLRASGMQVQRWIWEDSNSTGYDEFIYPYQEDIKNTFDLTFDGQGMYSVDGIALGGVIELLKEMDDLKNRINEIEGVK